MSFLMKARAAAAKAASLATKKVAMAIPTRTLSNVFRTADQYGDLHFISFLGTTLSRMAYQDDTHFLQNYIAIMGPIILLPILKKINDVDPNNLDALLDDQKLFVDIPSQSKTPTDLTKIPIPFSTFQTKKYIDFLALNIPQNINITIGETKGTVKFIIEGESAHGTDSIKYISIGWSNYGEVYVVADKRTPNIIYIVFRGTYSAKTAALYSKPTSIIPYTVCKNGNDDSFLYGIFKTATELIHTILEATRYLAVEFLGATKENSVKIFTAGHSLGGAMCSIFSYLWLGIAKTPPYNAAPYSILSKKIICISVGSPRCMSSKVADKFCAAVKAGDIVYLRITTRGDPVPGLPPKTGFQHPCSTNEDMRKQISEDCNAQLTPISGKESIGYDKDLDCQNYKTRTYIPNPLSHTIYLDISFLLGVDIGSFAAGVVNQIGTTKEVSRTPTGSTVCRVIMGETITSPGDFADDAIFKASFFDVSKARALPSGEGDAKVAEDVKMTKTAFDTLVKNMTPLSGDLCPQSGPLVEGIFTDEQMPDLSCPSEKKSGDIEMPKSVILDETGPSMSKKSFISTVNGNVGTMSRGGKIKRKRKGKTTSKKAIKKINKKTKRMRKKTQKRRR